MRRNPLLDIPDRDTRSRRIAGVLFFATCTSVFVVRWWRWETGDAWDTLSMWNAWSFTLTLMTILLAHELGHYAVARGHGFRLSLPWFLPAPVLVGTLGALIRLEQPPRDRTGLLEMGAAGPLAGAVVVVLVMVGRLTFGTGATGGTEIAAPLLWSGLSWILTGAVVPLDTADPVAFAAWLGCLLTSMNLLPIGQLDGGHVVAALSPRWSRLVGWGTTLALLLAGLWWPGWAVWAGLLHVLRATEPLEVRRPERPPGRRAMGLAAACAVTFVLTLTPKPF